MYKVVQYKY